jgi:hypothetical protein
LSDGWTPSSLRHPERNRCAEFRRPIKSADDAHIDHPLLARRLRRTSPLDAIGEIDQFRGKLIPRFEFLCPAATVAHDVMLQLADVFICGFDP